MTTSSKPQRPATAELAPRVVAWESTRACNFACVHCRAKAQKDADPNQLTTQEALHLVDQIVEFCKPIFIISGGDPLQRKDIFEIATYASNMGLRVVMSPSGSNLTEETFEKMKMADVKMISLSLDGSNPEVHDNFRQVRGAFELAMKNMRLAHECGFPFRINTTVTQHNLSDLFNIQKVAVEMGAAEWDVFMLVPTGRGKVQMEISPEQYEQTLQSIYIASLTYTNQNNLCTPIHANYRSTPKRTRTRRQAAWRQRMHGRQRLLLHITCRRSVWLRFLPCSSRQHPNPMLQRNLPEIPIVFAIT
jgi:MoaA/NifB/PqqE/SkfB family radical SAM enzyme